MKKLLVTGSPETEDQALEWLQAHGAQITHYQKLTIITLPADAILEKLAFHWQYALSFQRQRAEDCHYVVVDLDVDAYKTVLTMDSLEDLVEREPVATKRSSG